MLMCPPKAKPAMFHQSVMICTVLVPSTFYSLVLFTNLWSFIDIMWYRLSDGGRQPPCLTVSIGRKLNNRMITSNVPLELPGCLVFQHT